MPVERIRRASEVAVVYACCPCVGFCEWDPKVGRSLIAQGAHCLARSGVSRWLGGLSGWQTRFSTRTTPPRHSTQASTPQWRGWARWPLILKCSLVCVYCIMNSISILCICPLWICWVSIQSPVFRHKQKHLGLSQQPQLFTWPMRTNAIWTVIVFFSVQSFECLNIRVLIK